MAKNKMNGFLVALLIAIISFFVIFLFFPNASDRFFGVSLKHGDADITSFKNEVQKTVSESVSNVTELVTEKVTETVQETVNSKIGNDLKSLIKSGN